MQAKGAKKVSTLVSFFRCVIHPSSFLWQLSNVHIKPYLTTIITTTTIPTNSLKVWQRPFASTATSLPPPPDPYNTCNTSNTSSDITLPPDGSSYHHDSYDEQEINCPACILQVTCEIWAKQGVVRYSVFKMHFKFTTKGKPNITSSFISKFQSFIIKPCYCWSLLKLHLKLLYPINVALHLVFCRKHPTILSDKSYEGNRTFWYS